MSGGVSYSETALDQAELVRVCFIGQARWCEVLGRGLRERGLAWTDSFRIDTVRDMLTVSGWAAVRQAQVVVRVGFRPGARTWRGIAFDAVFRLLAPRPPHNALVMYWQGTDVEKCAADLAGPHSGRVRDALNAYEHWAGSQPLVDELADLGVPAQRADFPFERVAGIGEAPPLPGEFVVLTYIPDARPDFYGGHQILEAARAVPLARFRVMGGSGAWARNVPENVSFLGWVDDPVTVMGDASCLVRVPAHDSIGGTVKEALALGRHVIYSREIPHTTYVEHADTDGLVRALEALLERHQRGELSVDTEAAGWARAEFDPDRAFRRIASLCEAVAGKDRS